MRCICLLNMVQLCSRLGVRISFEIVYLNCRSPLTPQPPLPEGERGSKKKTLFRNPVSQPRQKPPPETGFLRLSLSLTRTLDSETRFLSTARNRVYITTKCAPGGKVSFLSEMTVLWPFAATRSRSLLSRLLTDGFSPLLPVFPQFRVSPLLPVLSRFGV
jgi:hypothetical protein